MSKPGRDRFQDRIRVILGCAFVFGSLWSAETAAAVAASDSARAASGVWDMSLNDTSRKCRMSLRVDADSKPYPVAMPAGCRKAMPILSTVSRWAADASALELIDDGGQPVLTFNAAGKPDNLVAKGPEGETYNLVATTPGAHVEAAAGSPPVKVAQADPAPPVAPTPPAAPAIPVPAGPDLATVAGRYDILRGTKDSGCMLTLDAKAKGPKSDKKAALAPACRDHGIVVFNPAGWRLEDGELVLTAKKGHETRLSAKPDGTWSKDGKKGDMPLILRKM